MAFHNSDSDNLSPLGIQVTKTNTCNGNGAQTDNLFSVTGTVKVLDIWGECTEATNSTDLADNSLALYDGTNTVEITDGNAPTDCSGITAGDILYRNGASASVAIVFINDAANTVTDVVSEDLSFIIQKKAATTTYIRHLFNGDANTDVDIKWYVQYLPLSADGAITAV
jgi:hypothetical protein